MMKSLMLSAALAPSVNAVLDPPSDELCLGKTYNATELDFFNSEVTENNLHSGGVLRFEDIGFVRERSVDLVISVVEGTTYTSAKAEERNGKEDDSMFGQINLFTIQNNLDSGQGSFRFCLHDHETDVETTADSFSWSIYDIDERNAAADGIKEKFAMDVTQAEDFFMYPNVEDTEIQTSCEDSGLAPPCAQGERTVFHSSTNGTGGDNPTDPNKLTEQQKKRSVVFAFKNTSCWEFTYDHYCRLEEETGNKCRWYGGGNFLFAGASSEVIDEGECIIASTDAPTSYPSASPTVAETPEPTSGPTSSPSASPTVAETPEPTSGPTGSPSASPTVAETPEPTSGPTGSPSASPTVAETPEPTSGPTGSPIPPSRQPTGEPTGEIEKREEDTDDEYYFPPSGCTSDIKLISTRGVTEFPNIDASPVQLKLQDTGTVTVALNQVWDSNGSVDSIYYEYKTDVFDMKCYQETDVAIGSTYSEVTIQCGVLVPVAHITICLSDSLEKDFLKSEDDATIPQCCHQGEPEGTPAVCYVLSIECTPGCDDISQEEVRGLRGSN
jgi:hypothetical protein